MNKLTILAVTASLVALAQPAAAQVVPQASQRVSVTGKSVAVVGIELAQAARQVCGAALQGGRKNLNYPSCVAETLGQARSDYAALRMSGPARAKLASERAS